MKDCSNSPNSLLKNNFRVTTGRLLFHFINRLLHYWLLTIVFLWKEPKPKDSQGYGHRWLPWKFLEDFLYYFGRRPEFQITYTLMKSWSEILSYICLQPWENLRRITRKTRWHLLKSSLPEKIIGKKGFQQNTKNLKGSVSTAFLATDTVSCVS